MMGDLAGILVLLGLVVLAVPVLLVMALVKIGNANLRIDALQRDVWRLEAQVEAVQTAGAAPAAATRSSSPSPTPSSESEPVSKPPSPVQAAAPPPSRSAAADAVPEAPITGRARFDLPDDVGTAAVSPPPLPPFAAAPGVQTSAHATDAGAGPKPSPRLQVPSIQRPPAAPPFDPISPLVNVVRGWFTEGNVPVKVGMLVLLAGVAALLKYASDQGWVQLPIEFRLAGIAAAAIAGLVFAWRQRETRRSFALSLQGGAIGVLMLVTFGAFKLYGLMPAGTAFGITIALVAGVGVLAVLQDALALAVFGILAGFLAPIWLSTGSGNHVALFSYYAVLNLGIFGIAWHRAWRLLNLLGFVFTFGIGTLWGVLSYQPAKFASTEPFLLLFFALYLLIPIFYAYRRGEDHDGNAHHLVDGTLVFGTPLVAFALQAGLLQAERMPLALSALGAAAVYALLAAMLRSRARFSSLVDTYAVLAVGFATLSVPLALSARATASVFALEGAALVWLGVRQARRLPQMSGLLLQAAAAVAYVAGVGGMSTGFSPMETAAAQMAIANPAFMGALLIALAGFATAWTYRHVLDDGIVGLFVLWAFGWWSFAGLQEIVDHVPSTHRVDAMLAFIVFTGWIAAELRRRLDGMAMLGAITAFALLLGLPFALAQTVDHMHPFGEWGPATWLLYAVLGWRALVCLGDTDTGVRLAAHGGWCWAWVTVLACTGNEFAQRAQLGDAWLAASVAVPVLAFASLLWLQPSRLASPLTRDFEDYRRPLLGSAVSVVGLMWLISLLLRGDSDPLPWIAVLNPLGLLQLAALVLMAQWAWHRRDAGSSSKRVPLFALAAFVWITFATLRATHHWGGASWSPDMLDDYVVQTALTVVWSVLGVLGWIFGSRRGDRLLWGAGAVLMGVVLFKLVLIDRTHLGNLFGIVSFIAYGLLCTAVGYFAPAPPRKAPTAEVSA